MDVCACRELNLVGSLGRKLCVSAKNFADLNSPGGYSDKSECEDSTRSDPLLKLLLSLKEKFTYMTGKHESDRQV